MRIMTSVLLTVTAAAAGICAVVVTVKVYNDVGRPGCTPPPGHQSDYQPTPTTGSRGF